MNPNDRWPEEYDYEGERSKPTSRRSSLSRRNSGGRDARKATHNSAPASSNTTPKKIVKPQNIDFVVTGKQILKRYDRANSLPAPHNHHRRPSSGSSHKVKRDLESVKKLPSQSSKSQETSLEDDMSLDLSRISDYEDTSKYTTKKTINPLMTSTPKVKVIPKSKSVLQSHIHAEKLSSMKTQKSLDSTRQCLARCSAPDAFRTYSSGSLRYSCDMDYSSVSPECSGQSSVEQLSPRMSRRSDVTRTPFTHDSNLSSSCVSSWQECSELETKVEGLRSGGGEWNSFWANYNNSLSNVPMRSCYEPSPTPYGTEDTNLNDFDISSNVTRVNSPQNIQELNYIIRSEGLHLTRKETQNMIKCAHILGTVLTTAIERRTKEREITQDPEREKKKKSLRLDLKETHLPPDADERKRYESVSTQTDISLPNTKSAPKIFENILRQLSKSSLEDINIQEKKE